MTRLHLPPAAMLAQIIVQVVYILFSIRYAAHPHPLTWLLGLILFSLALDHALRVLLIPKANFSLRFQVIAATNSLFINTEAFSPAPLFAASLFIVLSKIFIRDSDGRHIYNPSALASTLAIVLFPGEITYAGQSWGSFWPIYAWIIPFALFVSFKTRTIAISIAYIVGFLLFSSLSNIGLELIKMNPIWISQSIGPLFWSYSLLSFGAFIFTFNVITDPQTSPRSIRSQILFGSTIGLFDFFYRSSSIVMPDLFAYLTAQSLRYMWRSSAAYALNRTKLPGAIEQTSRST